MSANVFTETLNLLKDKARQHPSVLISFSGGKDSLAVLDLCRKSFRHVAAFYMYLVPGLRHIEERIAWARERYNIEILSYPHWVMFKCLRNGIYCPNHHQFDDTDFKLTDIYEAATQETGIKLIAHGGKDSDGLWRRRLFANTKDSERWKNIFYPIKGWSKYDVLAYLQAQKIPIPQESVEQRAAGMDLATGTLLWLHDTYPDDFDRIEKVFPYVRAVVKRREWYGVA